MRVKICQLLISSLYITATLTSKEASPPEKSLNIMMSSTIGGRSHVKYLMEINQLLRDRGHNVTYVAPEDNHKFNDPYGYNIYNLGKATVSVQNNVKNLGTDHVLKMGVDFLAKTFKNLLVSSYEDYFTNYEKLFKEENIDLIICDFFAGPCHDGARKHSIPLIIGFQGLGMGIANAPFITNTVDNSPVSTEKLSFINRLKLATIDPLRNIYKYLPLSYAVNEVRKKYGIPNNNSPWGAYDHAMKISNTYIGFDDARPIPSTLKLVGPIIDIDIPPLDSETQKFLDNHRTIYIAFGSIVSLNERLLNVILESIQLSIENGYIDGVLWSLTNTDSNKFPKSYTVKGQTYSTEDILSGKHPKIKILNWAPQPSILNHSNTKLFLSHGGLDSIFESINSGTPILVMPISGDQPRNSRIVKNRGIGDFVNTLTTNSADLFDKIRELTRTDNIELQTNVKHHQSINKFNNAKRLESALFIENYANTAKICRKTQPAKPFEIPCELEPYMQADSRMSFISAYQIDILLFLTVVGLISFSLIFVGLAKFIKNIIFKANSAKLKDE